MKWKEPIHAGYDATSINDAAILKRVEDLEDQLDSTTPAGGSGGAEPCTPDFAIAYERLKKGVRATFCVNNFPNDTDRIVTVIVRQADRTDQDSFVRAKLRHSTVPEEAALAASHLEYRFNARLEYETAYDLVRLITISESEGKVFTPSTEPVFNTAPLASFTTPVQFGVPSSPNLGLIVFNRLDKVTPEWDAEVGVKVWAPLTDAGAAQTWEQAGVDWVQAMFTRQITGDVDLQRLPVKKLLDSTELTQVDPTSTPVANRGYVILVARNLAPGAEYTWEENVAHTVDAKKRSTGPGVDFRAADFQFDLNNLTNVAINVENSDPFDGNHVKVSLQFSQPSQPITIKNFTLKRKKTSDSMFKEPIIGRGHDTQSDIYHQPSAGVGTVSASSGGNTVTGVGTSFTTQISEGSKIVIGAETLIIDTIASDTSLTTTTNFAGPHSGASYSFIHQVVLDPSMKTKPSQSYDVRVILRSRGGNVRTINASFSTAADGSVQNDTALVPIGEVAISKLVPKQKSIKVISARPTTNFVFFRNNEILMTVKNGGGTILGYIDDQDGGPVNSATPFWNELGADFGTHFNWKKSDILTLHPTAATIEFQNRITNGFGTTAGGTIKTLTISSWDVVASEAPTALATPSITTNTVDGDPEKFLARIGITFTVSGGGTFTAAGIAAITVKLQRRDQANSTGVGQPNSLTFGLNDAERGTTSFEHEFYELRMGERFRIVEVIAHNGDARTSTSALTVDFVAGNVVRNDGDFTAPAPSFTLQPQVHDSDSNKEIEFTVRVSQDGARIQLCKELLIEKSIGGGGFREVMRIGLKRNDGLHASSAATADFPLVISRKPNKSIQIRATVRTVGGTTNNATSSTLAANTDDVRQDSAAPSTPSAPDVQEFYGHFQVTAQLATTPTNVNTLLEHQYVMSTSASAPAGDPSVGSEGVVKIKKSGGSVNFKRNLTSASTLHFYVRSRNASVMGTWSSWSSGTSISTISRPLEDVIGTAVPTLPQPSVEIGQTSGTGHSTTQFKLRAGASGSNDFYNGNGLFIPAESDGDKVRKIVDYDGSTKFATVDQAFASAPPDSTGYDIYQAHVGWSNPDQTGTPAATCIRVFRNDTDEENTVEVFLTGNENGFSLTHIQIQQVRKSTGLVKRDLVNPISATPVFNFKSPSGYTPVFRVRMRNLYRGGGSDGWSSWTAYVEGFTSGAGTMLYDPSAITPPSTDYQDDSNYPTSRYNTY